MDTKYIHTPAAQMDALVLDGIIEKCLLGLATPEEETILFTAAPIYPLLQVEIDAVENTIEKIALAEAPLPPVPIKQQLFQQIRKESEYIHASYSTGNDSYTYIDVPSAEERYISVHKGWKTLVVVLFLLISLSLMVSLFYFFKYKQQSAGRKPAATEQAGH
ncbi:hypothetical protein KTO58_17055 [Chitinophaga pendula]|uniref:hypothetical protein n=1 Tax=Chitinophaga TaxID=79328 RepID=UPI0012FD3CAC|nr:MULTISPECIES: hypothetical protein [Chitinophaga]UCJ05399.1 hypothetical protein KTO58_17055 [Chitinophaga pendula]